MPANRFFINLSLQGISEIVLEGTEFHHLSRVMRVQPNEIVELTNGKGEVAEAKLVRINFHQAHFIVQNYISHPPPQTILILAQALPRFKSLEWIVEKVSELGLSELWIFCGEKSDKKELTKLERDRLNSLCIAAIKQSGNPFLPTVIYKPPLTEWTQVNTPTSSILYGDQNAAQMTFSQTQSNRVVFFNGPEKGFSNKEVNQFHDWKAEAVSLNPYTLRSETGAIVAIGQLRLMIGKQIREKSQE